ncbi:hypothetical protein ZIOFF_039868 [Zingiber officinale]|uniref:Uncharacterized protein n=1 Tax=Zingiber officinale TaxID=94328 RepID=A0A8J5G7M9_ZINOF|nr:hypothetical protein ZIOFF_039868 [Zingiber officinale]
MGVSPPRYYQAREKFMSLKKGARVDIVAELEENLHNNKSAFERCRFNLVNALSNIEAKKKFEFLESISAVMDAHMRYFKQGYELLSQMEPFIHQVLTYTQHSKEIVNVEQDKLEKRIQQFRTQSELASLRPSSNMEATTSGDGIHVSGSNSYKNIEDLMQSTANGKVQIIKQGYLLKRSSSLRADWKRRFFVLDSHGTLYYYIDKWNKQQEQNQLFHLPNVLGNGLEIEGDDNLFHTVDLRTSTIKIDAEQIDLRFCFRIISPVKSFILQAENEVDRMEWVEKIKGVIASLLNSTLSKQGVDMDGSRLTDVSGADTQMLEGSLSTKVNDNVSKILRNIPGNDVCAECGALEPEWASLNLGILVCIECSGVHRKLGVRSLTLDVKVWEPAVMDLFCALGNAYCNSVWEELLLFQDQRIDEHDADLLPIKKPTPKDVISRKEKYIRSKVP